ncbi:MAG: hypothetical protein ABA06_01755 [Parcubacteria bacterium C7867-001]|nr:MAG: hypothetical protein ABA06_01755 [Parcubacteria bacterium C7867-001]
MRLVKRVASTLVLTAIISIAFWGVDFSGMSARASVQALHTTVQVVASRSRTWETVEAAKDPCSAAAVIAVVELGEDGQSTRYGCSDKIAPLPATEELER